MKRTPIVLDCDPGVDDAIAMLLLHQLDQFEWLAVTSVAGNVGVERTTRNALALLEMIGRDIPVYRGADGPLLRDKVDASDVHGLDGMGGIELPCQTSEVPEVTAWDAIYTLAREHAGELEIIAVGPLTNLGLAFIKYPDLPKLVRRIVIMGGAAVSGNTSPAAEFNIFADPHAADIVFTSGVPVYMCGLDVTMQALMSPRDIDEIGALGSPQARFFREVNQGVIQFMKRVGIDGVNMHDPAAVLYAADDSYFETHAAGVRVETKGVLTLGKTVTDLYSDAQWEKSAYVVTQVDCEVFKQRVLELMSKY